MTKYRAKRAKRWVVGIDPSLTGFALGFWAPDVTEPLAVRFASKLRGVDRLIDIVSWVNGTIGAVTGLDVGAVCMEGYSFASANSQSHSLGELGGAVKLELRRMFPDPVCYPTIVAPSALKKFVTGKGNVAKDMMVLGVYKKWGYEAPNNDQADAYALARLAACMLGADQPRNHFETEVVEGLHKWTERSMTRIN